METQQAISAEIAAHEAADAGSGVRQPRLDYPPYRSSRLRHPTRDPQHADPETVELWAPCFGHSVVGAE
jgi:protocatechuate 3,4-dioxygenase, beta subunit